MAKSTAERVAAHRARQAAEGLVQVRLWVPPDEILKMRDYARRACNRFRLAQEACERMERERLLAPPPPPQSRKTAP